MINSIQKTHRAFVMAITVCTVCMNVTTNWYHIMYICTCFGSASIKHKPSSWFFLSMRIRSEVERCFLHMASSFASPRIVTRSCILSSNSCSSRRVSDHCLR